MIFHIPRISINESNLYLGIFALGSMFKCIHPCSILSANAISDGDKESECDEDGPSPEDSRKVNNRTCFVTH